MVSWSLWLYGSAIAGYCPREPKTGRIYTTLLRNKGALLDCKALSAGGTILLSFVAKKPWSSMGRSKELEHEE
eukprot:7241401-Karenia_brevis.AAC.1